MRVLITGGAAGIGLATAQAFAAEGHACLIADRDGPRAEAEAARLPGRGHAALVTDLADPAAREALAGAAGAVDVLVLNAGISDPSGAGFAEAEPEATRRLTAINLDAPVHLARLFAPRMPRGGRIVTLSSGAGLRALPFRGAYSPTKAALIAATRALAREMAPRGLSVFGIAPGFVRTELVEGLIAAGRLDPEQAVAKIPMGRMAAPSEIATAIRGLAALDGISGQIVSVDGGSAAFGGSGSPAARVAERPAQPGVVIADEGDLLTLAARMNAVLPGLEGSGAGVVILTGDEATDDPERAALAAGKRMAAQVMACEWARRGVRINVLQGASTTAGQEAAIRFLNGPEASYMTGAVLGLGA